MGALIKIIITMKIIIMIVILVVIVAIIMLRMIKKGIMIITIAVMIGLGDTCTLDIVIRNPER